MRKHDSGIRLEPVSSPPAAVRRRFSRRLLDVDRTSTANMRSLVRAITSAKSEYRRTRAAIVGADGLRRYSMLRKKLARVSRSARIRQSNALLEEIGVDRALTIRLRKAYLDAVRKLRDFGQLPVPPRDIAPFDCASPWVTYTAPYGGFLWSFAWERSDEPDNPVLVRHLDPMTGQIGSSIEAQLSGADNDDFLTAEYYTALTAWHTALATGPLEGYLAFEFRTSTYSGDVSDEFGLSSATFSHFGFARFRVADSVGTEDTQESRIFNFIDTAWGDDRSWSNYVAKPRDYHWYYFRTDASFDRGTPLLLEAGVHNTTWFEADDQSITMADDLDLRLDRIMVRSCPT